jgi:hypothetical protein
MGDLAIVTREGDEPGRAFGKMMGADDEFTRWFTARAHEIHGVVSIPATRSPSELVVDTEAVAVLVS